MFYFFLFCFIFGRAAISYTNIREVQEHIQQDLLDVFTLTENVPLPVVFNSGRPSSLSLNQGSRQALAGDIDEDDSELPHHRRYWKHAGMGASLGLSCSNSISGTLGEYVQIDGAMYLLTTDHFVRHALREGRSADPALQSPYEIVSPSLSDLADLRSNFQMYMSKNKEALDFKDNAAMDRNLRRWKRDHDRHDSEYVLGNITHLSGAASVKITGSEPRVQRTIDWALGKVTIQRQGENRHRDVQASEGNRHFYMSEDLHPKGNGMPCTRTSPMIPGASAYFVGAGTGYHSGTINAPLAIISQGRCITHKSSP